MLNFLVLSDSCKKQSFFFLRIIFASIFWAFTGYCNAGTFTWRNPSISSEWENPLNWSGSVGSTVPVDVNNKVAFIPTDEVIIVLSNNIPVLNSNQTVGVFRVNSGGLRINNEFNLNVSGNLIIAGGTSVLGIGGTITAGSQAVPVLVSIGYTSVETTIESFLDLNVNILNLYRNSFKGLVKIKHHGGIGTTNTGGNTYSEATTFESAGSSLFRIANTNITGLTERFVKDLTIKITSTGGGFDTYTDICYFDGNLILENTASTFGIRFGTATIAKGLSKLASGKVISIQNFSKGYLMLANFNQEGSTSQTLSLSEEAGIILGVNSVYDGILACTASVVRIDGGVYNSDVNIISKSSGNTTSTGTARFNGSFTFDNQGTGTCYLSTNSGNNYTYRGTTTFINSNKGYIEVSNYPGSMSTFSGLAKFENKGTAGDIRLGNAGTVELNGDVELRSSSPGNIFIGYNGTINLENNVKLLVPEDSYISGGLYLGNVIQKDATDQEIKLTGTSKFIFYGNGIYKGKIVVESPDLYINNGTFNGIVELTKSGISSNNSNGTVVFESDFLLNNKGTIGIGSVNTGNYTFKGNCTFNNLGAGSLYISQYGTSTFKPKDGESNKLIRLYNAQSGSLNLGLNGPVNVDADIMITNLSSGFVSFGTYTPSVVNLSTDSHINIESFPSGYLSLSSLKQMEEGVYPDINLSLPSARFSIGSSDIKSKLTVVCNNMSYSLTQFHNVTTFTVTNNICCNDNISYGGSVFDKDYTLTNAGGRNFYLGSNSGDIYYGNVVFNKNVSTGTIFPSNKGISEYYGNVTYNVLSGSPDYFGYQGGTTVFKGSNQQVISSNFGTLSFWGGVKIDKENNHVTLNTILNVGCPITFVKGNFITTPNFYFRINNPVSISGASNQSYIDGKVRRYGAGIFTFPVGKNGKYRPVTISDPVTIVSDIYLEYFNESPVGSTFTSPLMDVSECEYWNVNTITPIGNYTPYAISLGWDADACTPINPNVISVARYVSGAWKSEGNNNVTANYDIGTVTSNAANFLGNYNFTLGYRSKAFINTYNVNATTYKVTAGAEKFKVPYFTSGYNGTNNGVVKIHPDLNSTSVLVDINEGTTNASYNLELQTNASSNFTKVSGKKNGTFYSLSDKLYTINNNTITFYKDGTPSNESELIVLTNLEGGLVFKPSNPAPNNVFKITVPNFSNTKLEVINASGVTVYPENTSLQWDGKDTNGGACASGTYRFNLKINGSVIYQGQVILKN
ncbi:gliding motility-associated C-terminal domain-containing protein [Sporocytophaga myxococcoides]|uniref:gliding motility-associated C-terminal domain-containing protein n=1 Tax=Sporocytophaga myxococcoides TaxID=153721 RepID=UPI000403EE4A|nr:gliding motility-associated C-terminal domain-containing protein [Sporocytophaga myxococcoides]